MYRIYIYISYFLYFVFPNHATSKYCSMSGLVKVPLVLLFVLLGSILRFLVSSLLRPASDLLLKPLLVAGHNLVLAPLCSLLYNLSSMLAAVLSPCCRLPAPWRYEVTSSRDQKLLGV